MKIKWLVIHGNDVVQIVTDDTPKAYFKVYDWAVSRWNGDEFVIIPFNDDYVQTIVLNG